MRTATLALLLALLLAAPVAAEDLVTEDKPEDVGTFAAHAPLTFALRGDLAEILRDEEQKVRGLTAAGVFTLYDGEFPAGVALGDCVEIAGVAYLAPDGTVTRATGAGLITLCN